MNLVLRRLLPKNRDFYVIGRPPAAVRALSFLEDEVDDCDVNRVVGEALPG